MGTPSQSAELDGNYIEFQADVLRQLPRSHEIDAATRDGWRQNRESLKRVLYKALVPQVDDLLRPLSPIKRPQIGSARPLRQLEECASKFTEYSFARGSSVTFRSLVPDGLQNAPSGELHRWEVTTRTSDTLELFLKLLQLQPATWIDFADLITDQIEVGSKGPLRVQNRANYFLLNANGYQRKVPFLYRAVRRRSMQGEDIGGWFLEPIFIGQERIFRPGDRILTR